MFLIVKECGVKNPTRRNLKGDTRKMGARIHWMRKRAFIGSSVREKKRGNRRCGNIEGRRKQRRGKGEIFALFGESVFIIEGNWRRTNQRMRQSVQSLEKTHRISDEGTCRAH